jgi:hypothetical protein
VRASFSKLMMIRFGLFRVMLAVVFGLAASFQLFAYVPYGWKWKTIPVDYYINPANLDVPAAVAIAEVQAGAAAWTTQSSSPFRFNYVGTTKATTVSNNGRNEVFFRNGSSGAAIATTYYWYSGGSGVDADIIFWDGAYKFHGGSTGCTWGFYIQDVATHEFGHALGLGHTLISDATMKSGQGYCSTSKRSLAADDIAGVEYLYPPVKTNTAPVVTIVSPLPGLSITVGTSIALSGTAQDNEDGVLSSKIKWTSNLDGLLGTGSSLSKTLTVGTHTVVATVTDSGGLTRSASTQVIVTSLLSPWTFSATPASITSGQASVLSFTTNTANVANIFINGVRPSYSCGLLSCSGSLSVAPAATTTYTLRSTNTLGIAYPSLTTTVTVSAPASTWTFTANPATILSGQSSVLSFTTTTTDVHNIYISGQRPTYKSCGTSSCSWTLTVRPTTTTTYTLKSTNSAGTPYPALQTTVTVK